jgi:hypothetical protein
LAGDPRVDVAETDPASVTNLFRQPPIEEHPGDPTSYGRVEDEMVIEATAYAIAKSMREPLLLKGDACSDTDVATA